MLKRRSHLLNGMKIRFDARNEESGRRKVMKVQVGKVEVVLTGYGEDLFVQDKATLLCSGIGAP